MKCIEFITVYTFVFIQCLNSLLVRTSENYTMNIGREVRWHAAR